MFIQINNYGDELTNVSSTMKSLICKPAHQWSFFSQNIGNVTPVIIFFYYFFFKIQHNFEKKASLLPGSVFILACPRYINYVTPKFFYLYYQNLWGSGITYPKEDIFSEHKITAARTCRSNYDSHMLHHSDFVNARTPYIIASCI